MFHPVLCLQNLYSDWALASLSNLIVPFVSINYIEFFFLFALVCFSFQDGRNLVSGFNNCSSTNLSFVSKMFEEVSHSVLTLQSSLLEHQWIFPQLLPFAMHQSGFATAEVRRHKRVSPGHARLGCHPAIPSTWLLTHWFLKHLILNYKITTV
jgi:hypothetical protein